MPTLEECLLAIHRKCLDCCGGSREEVLACAIVACPLYSYRHGERRGKLLAEDGSKRQARCGQRDLLSF